MKTLTTLLRSIVPAAVLALGSAMLSGCSQSEAARIVGVDDQSVTVETAAEGPKTHEVAPDAKITLDGEPAELKDLRPGDKVKVITNQEGSLEAPREIAVMLDAKRTEGGPAASETEPPAPADEAVPPPQESDGNEPNSAEENPPRSDEADPAAPADERSLPPQESGWNEPPATENEESRSGDGAAASSRDDARADSPRGLSVVPRDETPVHVLHEGEISFVGKDLVRLRYRDVPAPLADEVMFFVTEETEILINGEAADIEDLQQGMTVAITAEQNGDLFVANQIEVRPVLVTTLAACGLATSSLLVLAADAEESGIRVRAPFVAVDINIGDKGRAADDTPGRMSDLLGVAVKDPKGQQLGTVKDVVVGTTSGQIRYVALSFGGFLGIGDQLVAVPWESLRFQHDEQGDEKCFLLDADKKALGDFPRIESDKWPEHLALEEKAESEASSRVAPEWQQDEPAEKAKSDAEVR